MRHGVYWISFNKSSGETVVKGLAVLEEKRAALAAGAPLPQGHMSAPGEQEQTLRRVHMTTQQDEQIAHEADVVHEEA